EGTLLKPNMVLSGYEAGDRAGVDDVASATLHTLSKHVPGAVPGIVFLAGGQSDEDATAHLNAMTARGPHPWPPSFSYGRALQAPALKAWGGKPENVEAAQRAYYHRAKMNAAARTGTYAPEMEQEAVGGEAAASGYSRPVSAESFASDCCATTRRTVPDRERITIESVTAPPGVYLTPWSSGPVVRP